MYSRLDPIFKSAFRHTEATDTRLGIRQEDKQEQRQKNHDGRDTKESSLNSDTMEVSVAALAAFLQNLLSPLKVNALDLKASEENREDKAQTAAAHAAHAYQKTARRMADEETAITPLEVTESSSAEINLSDTEIQTIKDLLADLRKLEKTGTVSLVIPQGESLLASLRKAMADAS